MALIYLEKEMCVNYIAWKTFYTITILLVSFHAYAGGEHWRVELVEKIDPNIQIIKIRLLERGIKHFDGCKIITVPIVRRAFWSDFWYSNPSKKETLEAIEFLNNKFEKSQPIYFGYMGGGFEKVQMSSCTFESRGLRVSRFSDGSDNYSVLSYYDYY